MSNFKKGDKIRIKDEVSSETHFRTPPHFTEAMVWLKDKDLTISGFTSRGYIEVEEAEVNLLPDWVEKATEWTPAPEDDFKKGDKIRIKDEVSSETHHGMPPHFTDSMDYLKDKVLTFSYYNLKGRINTEEAPWLLHPDWVEPVKEFKTGDKIRIKDEVSHLTHRTQFPHFMGEMEKMKDKVLTISSFSDRGYIKVEEFGFNLHPDWVEPVKKLSFMDFPEDDFGSTLTEIIKELSEVLTDCDSDSILEEAQEILEGDRDSDYGDPVDNFNRIADIASSILNVKVTPEQCVVIMMAVKLSREQYKHKRDNLVDLVAYTEILNRVRELNK